MGWIRRNRYYLLAGHHYSGHSLVPRYCDGMSKLPEMTWALSCYCINETLCKKHFILFGYTIYSLREQFSRVSNMLFPFCTSKNQHPKSFAMRPGSGSCRFGARRRHLMPPLGNPARSITSSKVFDHKFSRSFLCASLLK